MNLEAHCVVDFSSELVGRYSGMSMRLTKVYPQCDAALHARVKPVPMVSPVQDSICCGCHSVLWCKTRDYLPDHLLFVHIIIEYISHWY